MSSLTCNFGSLAIGFREQTSILRSEEDGKLLKLLWQLGSLWRSLTVNKLATPHQKWREGCSSSTQTKIGGLSCIHYLCKTLRCLACKDLVCTLDRFNRLARDMVCLDQLTQRRSLDRFWHPGQLRNGWLTVLLCPWSTSALLKDVKLGVQ